MADDAAGKQLQSAWSYVLTHVYYFEMFGAIALVTKMQIKLSPTPGGNNL